MIYHNFFKKFIALIIVLSFVLFDIPGIALASGELDQGMSSGTATIDRTSVPGDTILLYKTTGTTTFTPPLGVTTARVLVVGGGGGGGTHHGGGGGAGGMLTETAYDVSSGAPFTVTVGAGGAGGQNASGGNSVFSTLTAIGGGYGTGRNGGKGGDGGSGGGGGSACGAGNWGNGTTGQGNRGGQGKEWCTGAGSSRDGGGGGGAGGVGGGTTSHSSTGGGGGAGKANDITGVSVSYAWGGRGGGVYGSQSGSHGPANTGAGGGGGGGGVGGKNGGSGIVIVRFETQVAPSITTESLPDGAVGVAYSTTPAATDGAAPLTWSIATGSLPGGLSLNTSTGEISGTPTTLETATFTIRVTDDVGAIDDQELTIDIFDVAVATESLPGGTTGVAYSQTLDVEGGSAPYTWSVTSGTLPDGLSLNTSTGEISGTPTTVGVSTFTIYVEDNVGGDDDNELSITVTDPPVITTTSLSDDESGKAYSQTLALTGGASPLTWSVSAGTLPDGITLNAETGELSGTLTSHGTFNFTIEVTDNNAETDDQALSITIHPYAGGTGTAGDPYQLSNCYQLQNMNLNLASHFSIINEIDCNPTIDWNGGDGFIPVGDSVTPFSGSLDGQEHVIDTLISVPAAVDDVGLFGQTSSAALIENVKMNNAIVFGFGINAGSIVGFNKGTIRDSNVIPLMLNAGTTGGGLVGRNEGTIENSFVHEGFIAGDDIGGLVGVNAGSGLITDSYSTIEVSGIDRMGGFAKENRDSAIIRQSYSEGIVYSNVDGSTVGGFVAINGATISDAYAAGQIELIDGDVLGAFGSFVGQNTGTIVNSLAVGEVIVTNDPSNFTGGFAGDNQGTITASFWDTVTTLEAVGCGSASANCNGVTGKNSEELKDINMFLASGWDIEEHVVDADEEQALADNYPVFPWQIPHNSPTWFLVTFEGEGEESNTSRSSGTTIQGQVKNLLEMGNTEAANALMREWPHLFPGTNPAPNAPTLTPPTSGTCPTYTFTRNLRIGMDGEDVRILQQTLNCLGFTLAESGPGSPGEETNLFRALTHAAVVRFQEAHAADILIPLNLTRGTGYFAEYSRKKMGELVNIE